MQESQPGYSDSMGTTPTTLSGKDSDTRSPGQARTDDDENAIAGESIITNSSEDEEDVGARFPRRRHEDSGEDSSDDGEGPRITMLKRPPPKRQKVDSELPRASLSRQGLALHNCYVTEVLAFPESLAVFRAGVLDWNATCWLDRFPIPQVTLRKIGDHCNYPTLHERQICEFKGSRLSQAQLPHAPEIRLLVVFPHMKSFDRKTQRIWTDNIVLPSIYHHVGSNIAQHLPTSYRLLRLDSEAARMEGFRDVGDTPKCVAFQPNSLEGLWDEIVCRSQQEDYEEFRDAFLVVLGHWHSTATFSESTEDAWKTMAERYWDPEMDMGYIPTETFEVRIESEFRLTS